MTTAIPQRLRWRWHGWCPPHDREDYLSQWHHFVLLAGLVANVLRSLDRTHVQQIVSEKRKDWYYMKDLHKLVWKYEILQLDQEVAETDTGAKLARALVALEKQIGDGIEGDEGLVDRLLEALEALDSQRKARVRTLKAFNAKAGS
ncbi:hypothetical protein Q7P35_001518 [Cladosporium inversicolor]